MHLISSCGTSKERSSSSSWEYQSNAEGGFDKAYSEQTGELGDDEMREAIIDNTPLHRIASPSEVSDAVQYLASDAAGFVTGQIITVDGGRTLIDPAAVSAH